MLCNTRGIGSLGLEVSSTSLWTGDHACRLNVWVQSGWVLFSTALFALEFKSVRDFIE